MLVWYREGGPVMLLIALVAAAGLAVLVERFYVIVVRSKNNGRFFIERVIQMVRGGKIEDAIKMCVSSKAALADIGLLILRGGRNRDETDLQNVANAALLLVMPRLTRRLLYLRSLGIVAILLGLFGTVEGVRAALVSAGATITPGLAAALTPAAFGFAVSAALTLGRSYLESQSESITQEAREFSARLINALFDRPDVRLGHR